MEDAVSLRGASRVSKRFFSLCVSWGVKRVASVTSISRWIKRIGLYKLTKSLQKAQVIAIVDFSIVIGSKKCLSIIGVEKSVFERLVKERTPLNFENVELLHMELVESSNAHVVYNALKKADERAGEIVQTCTDGGSDILTGVRLFREEALKNTGKDFQHCYDMCHKIACLLKSLFEDLPEWNAFTSKAVVVKKQLQFSKAAYLCPPNQRSKSRYMNMEELSAWATTIQSCLSNPKHPDLAMIEENFKWIRDYEGLIRDLRDCVLVAGIVRHKTRTEGLRLSTFTELDAQLSFLPLSDAACQLAGNILDFVESTTKELGEDDLLLASSEIIESLFGKLKNLMNEDTKNGFTTFVLSAATCLGRLDEDTVKNALSAVTNEQVKAWGEKNIGSSVYGERKKLLTKNLTNKKDLVQTTLNEGVGQKYTGVSEKATVAA